MERAAPEDRYDVLRLAREVLDEDATAVLRPGERDALVVAREAYTNEVVGFALARREEPCLGHVLAMGVDRSHQGEGIGSALLRCVEHDMACEGAFELILEARADDARARAFYQRHGFRPEGLAPHAYGDGADAVRYARAI